MPSVQRDVMFKLYGDDVWAGYRPTCGEAAVQGWNGDHPSLARLLNSPGIKVVIDVGVWKGQSTITMATEMKRSKIDGCVISVDTFLGSPEHWNSHGELFTRRHGLPNLFDIFMSNVMNAGVSEYVVPLAQTSITAASVLKRAGIKAAVIHVDAAHEYEEVLRDASEYWHLLEAGGSMIGDDYHATWPGVVRAAGEFSALKSLPLMIEPPKWILVKQ